MNNRNKQSRKSIAFISFVFAGALTNIVGCQTDKSGMDSFFPADEARSTQQFMKVQAANGARTDGMLHAMHFDGEKLNSLGMAKLDLMLKSDESVDPMTVYLNCDEKDSFLAGRKDAVTQYLTDHGLVKDQIALKVGVNPESHDLSAEELSRLSKTEGSAEGAAPAAGATGSASSAEPTK